ncbi:DUF3325 domain-containing protein [Rhodovulum euryhalinum]|uniref:Uncharacterized protein DUF3325 n=1 Tax=Rhodovulum euryhalinum TaxID=35805 RepID=A0A4R2L4S8_9RHOB|nr:DUF3325 domain-containing protein [Rhodovulum euryhalinum]TCO74145.1 uncharacterized protein DUF3325 [Rhodovulum euryhalinum]
MLSWLSLTLAYAGFAALALSMPRHCAQRHPGKPTRLSQRLFQGLGWGGLGLSLWPAIAHWGVSIGLTAWLGLATVAAFALGMALSLVESVAPRGIIALPALAGITAACAASLAG